MTSGQAESYIATGFNFGHRTTIAAGTSTYLPLTGGTNQSTEITLIVPHDGTLKNLVWDCQSNGLTGSGNRFTIRAGNVHPTPAPAPALSDVLVVSIDGKTNGAVPFNLPVVAGQRIGVVVQTVPGGTNISRLRVSFELEEQRVGPTWQLDNDGSTVFYDGGNVGIGTATPAEALSVNGMIESENGGFKFPDGSIQDTAWDGGAGGGGSVISESGGKVGIGIDPTMNPQEKLTLGPNSNLATEMPTPTGVVAAPSPTPGGLPMDDYYFRVAASDGAGWTKSSAQLRFDLLDPNHGIRISWNPVLGATKYRVYRALTAAGAYKYLEVTNTYFDYIDDGAFSLVSLPPEETTAYINKLSAAGPSWVMGGKLGIGTSNPEAALHIKGNGAISLDGNGVIGLHGGAPGGGARIYYDNNGVQWAQGTQNGEPGEDFNLFNYSLYQVALSVSHATNSLSARAGVYAPFFNTSSSKRWKKNIQTIKGALSKVERLRGVSYDQEEDDQRAIGLVAEEVAEVIPEIVTYEKNGKDAQGLDYSRLVAVLIEAVKEQQGQIEELKDTVKALLVDRSKVAGLA